MRIDVGCEDVEFPAVESRVIDCYDFLREVTVDAREVGPDRLTRGRHVPFFKAKDNVQLSDSAFLTVYIDRVVVVNPSWLTVKVWWLMRMGRKPWGCGASQSGHIDTI